MTGTTNLNLTKPTVGGDSDAWGGIQNADLDTLDSHLQGVLYGLTLSAAGSTATFGVAAGAASGAVLGSAYTKTASSWALGTGNGSLDTGAIANSTWYHVWLIQRSDTGVVDILTSLSASSPTMPTNYDRKRRVGSMKTDSSGNWKKFYQNGNIFLWDAPVQDVAPGTIPSAATLKTLSVPTGVVVESYFNARLTYNTTTETVLINSPQVAAFGGAPDNTNQTFTISSVAQVASMDMRVITNTSAQIRVQGSSGDALYLIDTKGWTDWRGQ